MNGVSHHIKIQQLSHLERDPWTLRYFHCRVIHLNSWWWYVVQFLPFNSQFFIRVVFTYFFVLRTGSLSIRFVLADPVVQINPSSLGYSNISSLNFSTQSVENLFNFCNYTVFSDSCLVLADGLVSIEFGIFFGLQTKIPYCSFRSDVLAKFHPRFL